MFVAKGYDLYFPVSFSEGEWVANSCSLLGVLNHELLELDMAFGCQ